MSKIKDYLAAIGLLVAVILWLVTVVTVVAIVIHFVHKYW